MLGVQPSWSGTDTLLLVLSLVHLTVTALLLDAGRRPLFGVAHENLKFSPNLSQDCFWIVGFSSHSWTHSITQQILTEYPLCHRWCLEAWAISH